MLRFAFEVRFEDFGGENEAAVDKSVDGVVIGASRVKDFHRAFRSCAVPGEVTRHSRNNLTATWLRPDPTGQHPEMRA